MKKFNHVIVRRPCRAMVDGITSAPELGRPDYELALKEHDAYIEALKQCDVDVTVSWKPTKDIRIPVLWKTLR